MDPRLDIQNRADGQLQVFPTCPPSTNILVTSGWLHRFVATSASGTSDFTSGLTFDMANLEPYRHSFYGTYEFNFTFAEAGGYLPLIVGIFSFRRTTDDDATWRLWPQCAMADGVLMDVVSVWEDAPSSIEAERRIDAVPDTSSMAARAQKLCALVLRNNGNTSAPNQFLPIDMVNRGRSYIWRNYRSPYKI